MTSNAATPAPDSWVIAAAATVVEATANTAIRSCSPLTREAIAPIITPMKNMPIKPAALYADSQFRVAVDAAILVVLPLMKDKKYPPRCTNPIASRNPATVDSPVASTISRRRMDHTAVLVRRLCPGPCARLYSTLSIRSRNRSLSMSLMPCAHSHGLPMARCISRPRLYSLPQASFIRCS
ncbi:Uncharacterised protein [Mycobacteroides abscessus]|nr:Uncharacterised protein [Mycobacteroides abscessus]